MEESQFSLTIISPFSLKDRIRFLKVDLLFVILKQIEGFSLWLQSTHQMMMTLPFLRVSLASFLDFHCDDILGGDFNLILNLEKDKKGGRAKTHTKAINVINEYATKFDLVDA